MTSEIQTAYGERKGVREDVARGSPAEGRARA
jgi:hypothetical protein